MQKPDNTVNNFIYPILLGDKPVWPDNASDDFTRQLEHKLFRDGLHPLIYHLYADNPAWDTWPADVRAQIKKTAIHHTGCQMTEETTTRRLLKALHNAGIRPIVLKGSAISYTHYPENNIRTRGDIDFLFNRKDLPSAFRILESEGYEYIHRQGFLGQELCFAKTNASAGNLPLDVHWRISSYVLLAHVLSHTEIIQSAVYIPELATLPCAMNTVHALLHACIHLIKHTASGDSVRLLWLYDIYLLTDSLSDKDKQDFVKLSRQKKISKICYAALESVEKILPNKNMPQLLLLLKQVDQHESGARMLKFNAPRFLLSDLLSAGSRHSLFKSTQDILFPPGAYMLKYYGKHHVFWLPFLYLRRLASGSIQYLKYKMR
jgi:hypothetical protein